jgi:hypothetical protein
MSVRRYYRQRRALGIGDIPFNYGAGATFAPSAKSDLGELSQTQWLVIGAGVILLGLFLSGNK